MAKTRHIPIRESSQGLAVHSQRRPQQNRRVFHFVETQLQLANGIEVKVQIPNHAWHLVQTNSTNQFKPPATL